MPVRPLRDSQDKILSVLKQAKYHTGIVGAEVQHIIFIIIIIILYIYIYIYMHVKSFESPPAPWRLS